MSHCLYLFPHLPKTGGAAIFQNIERSLMRSQCLRLNCTHRQFYTDPRTKELCFYESEEDFNQLVESLSVSERAQIAFASGHDLPYGLHEKFPQEAKYFLFVREPIKRTISLYNYQKSQHEFLKKMKKMDESHRRLGLFSQKWFLIDGKVPSFEEWLEKSYDGEYPFYFTMTRGLQHLGYLDQKLKEDSWDSCLEKFFFVGLTEAMQEDEFYLYHELGIRRFWANRNASYPYISYDQLDKKTQEKIREKNRDDFILYELAKQKNLSFKAKHKNFSRIVKKMKILKRVYFFIEKGIPLLHFVKNRIRKWI